MFHNSKLKHLLKKKEVMEGKETDLEKGDLPALLIAAFSVFLPVILLFSAGVGLFIWLFLRFFH